MQGIRKRITLRRLPGNNGTKNSTSIKIQPSILTNKSLYPSGPVEAAKMTLEQPAGEMWQKIREELNEKADTKEADLAHIKEWLKKEPHLPDEFGEY